MSCIVCQTRILVYHLTCRTHPSFQCPVNFKPGRALHLQVQEGSSMLLTAGPVFGNPKIQAFVSSLGSVLAVGVLRQTGVYGSCQGQA